ncbi:MAG: hypothetical protein ACREOG_19895 [Gemmatimonadaceae bacterium]
MGFLISFVAATAAVIFGFSVARNFTRSRLRYVDAVNHPLTPIAAGIGACVLGAVVVPLLPFVGLGTAMAFGASVGLGVASGAREIRRALPPGT